MDLKFSMRHVLCASFLALPLIAADAPPAISALNSSCMENMPVTRRPSSVNNSESLDLLQKLSEENAELKINIANLTQEVASIRTGQKDTLARLDQVLNLLLGRVGLSFTEGSEPVHSSRDISGIDAREVTSAGDSGSLTSEQHEARGADRVSLINAGNIKRANRQKGENAMRLRAEESFGNRDHARLFAEQSERIANSKSAQSDDDTSSEQLQEGSGLLPKGNSSQRFRAAVALGSASAAQSESPGGSDDTKPNSSQEETTKIPKKPIQKKRVAFKRSPPGIILRGLGHGELSSDGDKSAAPDGDDDTGSD